MRRAASTLLLALGIFALVLGGLLRFYVYNTLGVAPLDPDSKTVSRGTQMTVFYPGKLKSRTDATVTATRIVRGSLTAPEAKVDGDVAVWRVGLVLEDDEGTLVSATEERVCVDRRTAASVENCSEQSINDDTSVKHIGLAYKFPFNTEKKDYQLWDYNLKASSPAKFDGEDLVNGLPVYRFVQAIAATKIADVDVPGDLVNGQSGTTVRAGRFYQNVRTVWVEPYSGTIVKGQEEVKQVLRGPDGRDGTVLLSGTIAFTQDTVQKQVADAKEARDKLRLIHTTGPLVLLIVGVILSAIGVLLMSTGRRATGDVQRHRRQPVAAAQG